MEQFSNGEYWNISGVPVLPENVIFTYLKSASVVQKLTILGTHCPIHMYQYLQK